MLPKSITSSHFSKNIKEVKNQQQPNSGIGQGNTRDIRHESEALHEWTLSIYFSTENWFCAVWRQRNSLLFYKKTTRSTYYLSRLKLDNGMESLSEGVVAYVNEVAINWSLVTLSRNLRLSISFFYDQQLQSKTQYIMESMGRYHSRLNSSKILYKRFLVLGPLRRDGNQTDEVMSSMICQCACENYRIREATKNKQKPILSIRDS